MEMKLKNLTERTYYLPNNPETDRPILAAICGEVQTLIVDSGNSSDHAEIFLYELERNKINTIHSVVLTHWHWDHSFGAHHLNKLMIAHEKTTNTLREIKDYCWTDEALDERVAKGEESPFCAEMIKKEYGQNRDIVIQVPSISFKDELKIDLGGLECIIRHVGGDHSDDSTIVYVPEERVLFLGDCLYPSVYTKLPEYTVTNMRILIGEIEKFDAAYYVLSHQDPIIKEEFDHYVSGIKLICDLVENTKTTETELNKELQTILGRNLSKLKEEIIFCFVNGLNNRSPDNL